MWFIEQSVFRAHLEQDGPSGASFFFLSPLSIRSTRLHVMSVLDIYWHCTVVAFALMEQRLVL